jgi:hypothetical protein
LKRTRRLQQLQIQAAQQQVLQQRHARVDKKLLAWQNSASSAPPRGKLKSRQRRSSSEAV